MVDLEKPTCLVNEKSDHVGEVPIPKDKDHHSWSIFKIENTEKKNYFLKLCFDGLENRRHN
jgi:hypothetical protein